uniref:Coiled-coil domain-containing protein-like n=1 Tax=Caenorhabditis tropicalis TaxID=1561998 RepID=A0A1I7TS20_9PELO
MPKGGASSLTPVYAGLREDLDAFLRSFLQLDSVRFSDYKRLFEHRGMVHLFSGRSNSAEIIEFNECLLVHCLPYMEEEVCPGVPRSLHERIFGLYSLYTFFYVQHSFHVVKVRMDPDASRNFRKLTELLLQEKIYDAYMICLKLLEDKAFKHVAFIMIHDPSNFKRFYTDDKISHTILRANLNDPLGNVKALIGSEEFEKLDIIRREYIRSKKRAKFEGFNLEDVQGKMKQIMEQYSRSIEGCYGVNEIINTDHSSEHLSSRGMLRSTIKEQAHSSDLKLARYRRHRSATPLDIPTDTFDYVQEFEPEVKAKRVKPEPESPESTASPPLKYRTRQGLKNEAIKREEEMVFSDGSPPRKVLKVHKREPCDAPVIDQLLLVDSVPDIHISNKIKIKEELAILNRIDDCETEYEDIEEVVKRVVEQIVELTETMSHFLENDRTGEMIAGRNECEKRESLNETHEMENDHVHANEVEPSELDTCPPSTSVATPRSIMKKRKSTISRHVSFREDQDGELDTTIHEIPSRMSELDEYLESRNRCLVDESDVPAPFSKLLKANDDPAEDYIVDDDDMFRPFEGDTIGPGWTEKENDESEDDIWIEEEDDD